MESGSIHVIITSTSLRGYEDFYTDLARLRVHLKKGHDRVVPLGFTLKIVLTEDMIRRLSRVAIFLLGKFKGEGGANYHTINVADTFMSDLQMRWWVKKLISIAD